MGDEQSKFEKEKDDDESDNEGSDSTGSALGAAILLAGAAATGAGLLKLYQTYNKTENCHSYSNERDNAESSRFSFDYPNHWSVSEFKADEDHFCLVICEKGSKEFKFAESLMRQSMPRVNVTSVERIENKKLYESYRMKKVQMERINGKIVEKHLFHCTQIKNIKSICYQGFDLRLNGERNGTLYGHGIYFAVNAKFSDDKYSEQSFGEKKMFLANVLVGKYINGKSHYKRPPPLDSTSYQLYDSCVDCDSNPTIFAIFESAQVYPEYLISYY